jgi:colanic acid biosynthesis glycosyl transferase WcaI
VVKVKILVVSQHFWPENFRVNDLVLGLKARGHEVTVLTGLPNYPVGDIYSEYIEDKSKYSSYEGINVVRVPVIPRKKGKGINLIFNFLSFVVSGLLLAPWKLRGQQFDKIFVFGNSPITVVIPAILLSKLKKAPLCFWVMDLWPEMLITMGVIKKGFQERIARRAISYLYSKCDLILGQSRSFVNSIKELTAQPVKYFPSWSDVPKIDGHFELNSPDTFNIIFAGNIGESQDFPSILKAAEILKANKSNVKLIIVGDGRDADNAKVLIDKQDLSSNIKLMGSYPLSLMPSLFEQADTLLVTLKSHPVYAKTIPGKLQAYLGAGKPILAMLDGEGANVVNESKSGIAVNSGNYKQLAEEAMRLSCLSNTELDVYAKNGKEYYMANFDRELVLNNLVNLLDETE